MSRRPSAPPPDPIVITKPLMAIITIDPSKPLDASSMTLTIADVGTDEPGTLNASAPLFLSVEDAAKLLGIGKTLAWDLVKAGEIPTIRLGTRRLVPRHEVVRMVYRNE